MTDDKTNDITERVFTQREVDELLQAFYDKLQFEQGQVSIPMPHKIHSELEISAPNQLQDFNKRFKKECPKYELDEWLMPQKINASIINTIKRHTVETTQVLKTLSKSAEIIRFQAKMAMDLYEQTADVLQSETNPQQIENALHQIQEKCKRLSIYGIVTAKDQETEARSIATKAMDLPPNLRHLENANDDTKSKNALTSSSKWSTKQNGNTVYYNNTTTNPTTEEDVVIVDRKGKRKLHQCPGIDCDTFCPKTPYTKIRKLSSEYFYQQYNSIKDKSQTSEFLESKTRPGGDGSGCISTTMAEERHVPISTMEVNSTSVSQNSRTEDTGHDTDYTLLDNPTLVPNASQYETKSQSDLFSIGQVDNERLVIIGKRQTEDLNEEEISYLQQKHRTNTLKVYNVGWRKWADWCHRQNPKVSPEEYTVSHVLKFLMANRHYSVQHLNGIRFAITSVFKTLHPHEMEIAQQKRNSLLGALI
ncbi:hypothetical protein G6F56_003755 [Rhizopus delemar]|nr:hypothetical protein G6F56_003755 [Rhizopus delemar]